MGSGKSRVGKEIAKFYELDHYDTDVEIEKKYEKSIDFIFKKYGEKYFRDIEETECLKLLDSRNCVISLGGGSIINSKIREKVKKCSHSIYLKVDIEILRERLKKSQKRPLLKNTNTDNVIEKIFNSRQRHYNKADLIIENNSGPNDIIKKIINNLKKYE